jgi:hypothetical protein
MDNPRVQLDRLFTLDAAISVVFGLLALLAPHGIISKVGGGYNHSVHETLRFVFNTNYVFFSFLMRFSTLTQVCKIDCSSRLFGRKTLRMPETRMWMDIMACQTRG